MISHFSSSTFKFSLFYSFIYKTSITGGLRKILKQDSKTRCEFQYYYRMTWKKIEKVCVYAYVIPLHKHFFYIPYFPQVHSKVPIFFLRFSSSFLTFYKLYIFSILNLSTRRKNIISYSGGKRREKNCLKDFVP